MVRNYVRKTDKAASYTKEQLLEAVEKVKKGEISAYRASLAYKIPRPTIVARVYNRYGLKSNSLGRSTVIPEELERKLAINLHAMEKYGFGLTRKEILELVGHYVTKNNIKNPFKNGVPGEDWFLAFKKRHSLSVKKPQAVENSRKKACNPWVIYAYFDLLKNTLDELGLHDKPTQIWNLDETSFSKDPSKTKVVGLKGYASTRTIASPGKDNTTVLLGCSAAGNKTPPLIIFKGKNLWDEWTTEEAYPGTVYAATKNGWMETEVFETFFNKVFLPTVGPSRPVLLIYDGHSTHVGINIIESAREAGITILKIPPHTSDNLQPLDLAVNKSFKDKWDETLVKWQRQNIGTALPKKEFSKLIGKVWAQVDPKVCAAGFRKGGIYPFNRNAVSEEKFHPDQLAEWKKQQEQTKQEEASMSTLTFNSKTLDSQIQTIDQPPSTEIPCSFSVPSLHTICINHWNFHHNEITPSNQHHSVLKATSSTKSCRKEFSQYQLCADLTSDLEKPPQNEYQDNDNLLPLVIPSLDFEMVPLNHDICVISEKDTNKSSSQKDTTKSSSQKVTILDEQPAKSIISFEELLLQKIKFGTHNKQKRTKVAAGAEIITREDVYKKQKNIEEEKLKKLKEKEEKQAKKLINEKTKIYKKTEKVKTYKSKRINEINTQSKNESHTEDDDNNDGNVNGKGKIKNVKKSKVNHGKKKKNKPESSQKKKRILIDDSTSESDIDIELMDESDIEDGDFLKEDNSDVAEGSEEIEINEYDDPLTSTVVKGQWVLVKFATKTCLKHYVGVVTDLHSDIPTVKFVRKSIFRGGETKSAFVYPQVPDICEIRHLEDIVCKLPDPIIGRRGQIFFKISFQGYNIH